MDCNTSVDDEANEVSSETQSQYQEQTFESLEDNDSIRTTESYVTAHDVCGEIKTDHESDEERTFLLSNEDKQRFASELSREDSNKSLQDNETLLEFWDFGGQYIFYATHTMFHSGKAIYLLVLDLTTDLSDIKIDKDFPSESHERNIEYFVRFWLNSIHSFVGSEDGYEPTVILVGTHKDKLTKIDSTVNVDSKIESFFENIRRLFDGTKLLNHIYPLHFAVDNTAENDESVNALREAIVSIGIERAKTVEIPAKWLPLEKSLKETKHLKIVSFKSVMEKDSANEFPLGSEEQVKLFLQYHHAKGTYIYFDEAPLSQHVVLDPQYLIDAFKCIITTEHFRSDPEIRPLCNSLLNEARLEKLLIEKQWSKEEEQGYMDHKEVLLAFLTKHHIISEATAYDEDDNTTEGLGWFVVPSLLRNHSVKGEILQFLAGKRRTQLRFIFTLDNNVVVETIYHRLVAAVVGKWPIVRFESKSLMYKDICFVRLNKNHVGMTAIKNETIELNVLILVQSENVDSVSENCGYFRRFVESVILHEFHKLRGNRELPKKPFSCAFRCNHESHGLDGSLEIIDINETEISKPVPCPDLYSHDIDLSTAKSEWFTDGRGLRQCPKTPLTNKILSKVADCVGRNWQTLGHELGVTHVQIERIVEDNPSMKIYSMLQKWKQAEETPTMDILLEAMKRCRELSVDWDEMRNIIDTLCDDL